MMLSRAASGSATPSTLTLTVDHTKCGTADTSNYPLRVDITHASLKSVANGGLVTSASAHDVRFTSDFGGSTLLNWDAILLYDATAGRIVANVKIGTLSHSSDNVLYMQIGDAGITTFQGGTTGLVWDSNYKYVPKIGDGGTLSSLVLTDLTSNANNGTNSTNNSGSLATVTAGPAGAAIDFTTAVTNQQYVRDANVLNLGNVTLEAWVKFSALPASDNGAVIHFANNYADGTADKVLCVKADGHVRIYIYNFTVLTSTTILSTNTWHYLVGLNDGSNIILYVDGASEASAAASGSGFAGYSNPNCFINGESHGGVAAFPWNNKIADPRVSAVGRSASYVTATWNNINSPSTFITVT